MVMGAQRWMSMERGFRFSDTGKRYAISCRFQCWGCIINMFGFKSSVRIGAV
jgi:hypothetical protein